ncbi:MAG TPA: efflux transporter outer membrane subunit [Gemmatimonadaceae bacterium]|nr:efflux transporter outer membrane subunit [Gemmatimonadaceae bacterium]
MAGKSDVLEPARIARALAIASLGAGLAACAVGPSTKVEPRVHPVPARADSAMSPAARAFLDSLATARESGAEPSGEVVSRPEAARRADTTERALPTPAPLEVDPTRDLAWLDVLQDSQLVALVDSAVANNRDLRVAQALVREFRALNGVAKSGLFPQLSANGSASTNKVAFGPNVVKFDAVRITGDLSWELDFWGRLRRQAEAGHYDYLASRSDARATALTLVSDVATAYLQLRELDADLRIAQQTLESRQTTLELARRRYSQGIISELDVRQFEAELADPAARVADFARMRVEQENALALLLGRQPGHIPRGGSLEEAVRAVSVPDSIPGELIARRPDVMGARRRLQSATARIGVAIGDRLPTIMLGGSYGAQKPDFNGLFDRSGELYTAQVGISIPLFTGGRLANQERAARAVADEARGQYEQTVLNALREASDALAGVKLNRDQLVAQATQAQALQRAFALAQERYRSGISSYLEVLDAQRSLFTAQLALVQVQRQYLVSTVELYRALGGGWTETGGEEGR